MNINQKKKLGLFKPKIEPDWDENRRKVTNSHGEEFVLFKDRANEVFEASNKVYKKHLKRYNFNV